MSLTAVALLLISAVAHAGWNLLGKRAHPSASFLLAANTFGCLCLAPFAVIYGGTIAAFPPRIWPLLAATGFCQAVYYAALAGAYRSGPMTVAYPLARSSPIIVVTIVTVFLGRGDQVTWQCIAGILLVVAGCFMVPMARFDDLRLRNYLNLTCLLALAAAFGTSGYSIIDDDALRLLRQTPGIPLDAPRTAVLYAFLEGLFASAWLALFILTQKRERVSWVKILRAGKRPAALTGAGIYLTYTLVLIAMAFVQNVSYVVAFRQISIPLGTVLGVALLKEPGYPPKYVGVAVMFVGLALVGAG